MLQTIIFYLFSTILVASAMMVVTARNPVHAVLFLILCFFNAAGLFILLGAEFIAFILVIVYVGAVAVLFLFVVMMLDVNFQEMRKGFRRYLAVGLAVGVVLLGEMAWALWAWSFDPKGLRDQPVISGDTVESTRAIGQLLYTDYFYPFQVSGLILLVAMVGAIVLTLRTRKDSRRQRADQQIDRRMADVVEIVKVESGKGVL